MGSTRARLTLSLSRRERERRRAARMAWRLIGMLIALGVVTILLGSGMRSSAAPKGKWFLSVRDMEIVDAEGNEVRLRGFNVELRDFGAVLGEKDIARIAETGANVMRLVLDYRDLESAPFRQDGQGFALIDRVLDWCEGHGIYVILDMHLAPGIQNPHDFVVHREKTFSFWSAAEYQERFHLLWEAIAKRYAHRRIIAGYDLLNEGVPPGIEDYRRVLEEAVKRIRAHDRNHIVIVEEAIMPDGRKELPLISDRNAVYSIHFFHPPQFAFYVTTSSRTIAEYPGEMLVAGRMISEARGAGVAAVGWEKVSVTATPPEDAQILVVRLSREGSAGSVRIDDVRLEHDGGEVDLPAPGVRNGSFEIDYPGISWTSKGSCAVTSDGASKTGTRSLEIRPFAGECMIESSPIPVKPGTYTLSAWQYGDNPASSAVLTLSWHGRRVLDRIDRDALIRRLAYAKDFRERHRVPLYVGEFTCHANPEQASIGRYLGDLVDLMENYGFHWTFWTYYSKYRGVGIFTGIDSTVANPEALKVLGAWLERKGSIVAARRDGP